MNDWISSAAQANPAHANDSRTADAIRELQHFAQIDPEKLAVAERTELIKFWAIRRQLRLAALKTQIVDHRRVDLLASEVLGYEVKPFHRRIIQFQFQHRNNLQLAFRGAGKSTVGTIAKGVFYLCVNRSLRLVIASKKYGNAQGFLKTIAAHLMTNEMLIEMFGHFKDPNPKSKLTWNEDEIVVVGREQVFREASISCAGADTATASKHFDVEFSDDIVDNTNSTTKEMRDKVETWYNSILDPCMEPPDDQVPYRGDRNRLGTRYHHDDLYARWMAKNEEERQIGVEPSIAVNVIPALDEDFRSPWPEKWPPEEFLRRRRRYGKIIFDAQYQCNTEGMKGTIIQIDDCQPISQAELATLIASRKLRYFMGVDLAISDKQTADRFALVVIGMDEARRYYVVAHYRGRIRFVEQTRKIIEMWQKWKVERIAIEANGYQGAQLEMLKREHPTIPLRRIVQKTGDDKTSRCMRLSAVFEDKRVFFPSGCDLLIDELVRMPNVAHDDSFDAFDLAVAASNKRERRARVEPGIM